MNAQWTRYIGLSLALVSAILAYRSSAGQPRWIRLGRFLLSLAAVGAAEAQATRRPSARRERRRIMAQSLSIAVTVLGERYPARRPLLRVAALGAGLGLALLERPRVAT